MKSLKNKKGFTIVELVIVIAVIAILAAVMIPTFSNVVEKANESKALQEAVNAYKEALIAADGDVTKVTSTVYTFTHSNGVLTNVVSNSTGYTYEVKNGSITKATKSNN